MEADDAEPSDTTRIEIIKLVELAVRELSADVESVYSKKRELMSGSYPSLEESRERAVALCKSEIDIDFLLRQRKRLPLGDVLRSPRYEVVREHWKNARALAENDSPDIAGALQKGTLALEALAKIVAGGGCATLGDCIKTLRSRKLIDSGIDKVLEGLWMYSSAQPGVRHAAPTATSLTELDWQTLRPMLEGAIAALLLVDAAASP
jgi:hypothetical protein